MAGRATRLFISYKTGKDDGLSGDANNLKARLIAAGYDVWMDDQLEAGIAFNKQIYQQIPECDILLLLMSQKSAESKWVNREVDVAKGAGVFILPLLIRTVKKTDDILSIFDLKDIQYIDYRTSSNEEFKKLCEQIDAHNRITFTTQSERYETLSKRNEFDRTVIKVSTQEYAIYALGDANDPCKVYIAAGNIIDMTKIDVLVNSENDYMQMARAFESGTVSSMLRYQGSKIKNKQLLDDSVQDELNIVANNEIGRRPVPDGVVLVTSSGHPDSPLYQENNAYYIFHVASVTVVGYGPKRKTQPVEASTIKDTIKTMLTEIIRDINKAKGVISPAGTPQREIQEARAVANDYKDISSIIFPMFGTGHGKRSTEEALEPITEAFVEYIKRNPSTSLERIYLCVHYSEELEMADRIFQEQGLKRLK